MLKAAGWPPSIPRVAGASDLRPYAPGVLLLPEGPAVHPAMLLPELQVALPNRQRVRHHQAKHEKCLIAPLREHLPVSFPIPLVLLGPLCRLADDVYVRGNGNSRKEGKRKNAIRSRAKRIASCASGFERLATLSLFFLRLQATGLRNSIVALRFTGFLICLTLSLFY